MIPLIKNTPALPIDHLDSRPLWRGRLGRFLFTTVVLVLSALAMSGCAGLVRPEQPSTVGWESLSADQTVGQTFVGKYNGLSGVYFYLSPQTNGDGQISLHLRPGPKALQDLAGSTTSLPIDSVKSAGYYGFFIPPQSASNQAYYYAFLEVKGAGAIQVGMAAGDTYLNGALYKNGAALDGQAAFQLSYSRQKAFLGLAEEALSWVGILFAAFFLFALPGWGLFSLLWPGWSLLGWPEKLGLSAGLSLALYPLLFLWTSLIGLHLGPVYAWIPPLAGAALILWRNWKSLRQARLNISPANLYTHIRRILSLPDLVFLILLVLLVFTRFWVIRSVDIPMWGDSYQHTMMAQLLVDHGGLFNSWLPYAELQTFTYHFGFHADAAVFHWLTNLDVSKSVLWTGQIINILAVIALYPLAARVGKSRWAGVAAVLVAGLLSPMPMYYVNWGRYTQLAGQVILPGAVYLAWTALRAEKRDYRLIGLVWVILAGLALTHYLVTILTVSFFIAFFIIYARRNNALKLTGNMLILGGGALVLFVPWLVHVFLGKLLNIFTYYVTAPTKAATTFLQGFNSIGAFTSFLPIILWLLFPLGLLWGFWRREKNVLLIGLWWFLNLLATNPQWFHLPGAGVITNFTLFIAAYIPAGLLIGVSFGWLLQMLKGKFFDNLYPWRRWAYSFLLFIFVIGIAGWGLRQRLHDLNVASGSLVTRPDEQAAAWIRANTPQNARFLVNSFFAYGDSLIAGSDGGWWLPLLAGRQTTLPPLTYGSEQGPRPDFIPWVNKLCAEIQGKGITDGDVMALLREREVRYVYIGQRQGLLNEGQQPVLNPADLLSSSSFWPVYHQDRVWIFEVVP